MARFLCHNCEEVVMAGSARFAFCCACGAPLTIEDMLPIQLVRTGGEAPEPEAIAEPTAS